jgi:ribosomal protein L4
MACGSEREIEFFSEKTSNSLKVARNEIIQQLAAQNRTKKIVQMLNQNNLFDYLEFHPKERS